MTAASTFDCEPATTEYREDHPVSTRTALFQEMCDGLQVPLCLYWRLDRDPAEFEMDQTSDLNITYALIRTFQVYGHDLERIVSQVPELWPAFPVAVLRDEASKILKNPHPPTVCDLIKGTSARGDCEGEICEWKGFEHERNTRDSPRPGGGGGGENEKTSFATRLVELATEGSELWHSPEDEAYITFHRDGHKEHHPLKDRAVKLWLSSLFHRAEGRTPGSQAVQDALNVLEGMAMFEGPEYAVYVRVAPYEDKVYVDLGRPEWECIEISSAGWSVVSEAPVKFWRPKTMGQLPMPENGGDWNELRKLINAGDDRTWRLIVGWLVQGFWPSGPYAHLNFTGEQGSGKTKAQEMLKSLIDPSATILRRPPRDEKDLMIAAKNERIPSFDNLSGMPDYLSDAFCCLSTGAALGTRELYTDSEEAVLLARRPCMMNGIDTLTYRGDLLDRTIVIELPKINERDRKLEKDVMAAFEAIRPKILGLILDATVSGLKHFGEVSSPELPRMADLCLWVMACEESLPWEKGEFLKAYMGQVDDSIATLVDGDQVARAVFDLALELAQGKRWFEGTATELLEELSRRRGIDLNRAPRGWPKTANHLSSRLRRVAPALRKRGVVVDSFKPDRNTKLVIVHMETIPVDLETIRNKRSSPQNQQASLVRDDGDDRDDELHIYSVHDEEKREVDEKESGLRRIDGKKIVSIVSSSPMERSSSILPETMQKMGSSPIVSGSSQAREKTGTGPHPRRDLPTPSLVPKCAVCGEDLPLGERSHVQLNSKIYCAKPGCGYPKREEVSA